MATSTAGAGVGAAGMEATLILRAPSGKQTAQAHAQAAAPPAAPAQHAAPPPPQAALPRPPERPSAAVTLVSVAELRAIMTHLGAAKADRYITPLNQAMGEFHVDLTLRKAAFLGQVAHESGELQWFQEFASGREYDLSVNPRKARELGNVNPGDGPRYKGRGPIQLTGRNNYRACGKALQLDLEGNPDLAIQPSVAFRTACWFWSTHGLNALADQRDYRAITRRINGGYTHYAERLAFYERALQVLGAPAAAHA